MSYEKIKKAELEAGSEILEKVRYFSTVFYIPNEDTGFFVTLGSGTFVRFGSEKYVLTASHVIDEIRKLDLIGISIGGNGKFYRLETKYLDFKQLKGDRYTEEGPDIGLMRLPSIYTGQVEASGKIFYEISKEKTLEQEYGNEFGFWAIAGWPEERIENQIGKESITKAVCQINLTLDPQLGGRENDLLSLKLPGASEEHGLKTHGGMSGGGCWHAILGISGGKYYLHDISLRGVVFYEFVNTDAASVLIAHEKNAIYKLLSENSKA